MIRNISQKILINYIFIILIMALLPPSWATQEDIISCPCGESPLTSKNGAVLNEETAKKIAEAILIPIYGKNAIEKQKPFSVSLKNDTWVISGYLPEDMLGGTFLIIICKQDGRIIKITHGR
ncbi:YbbC/YhhH family protein [Duganella violaceipulchra]|uniref:YbbC/YhhH family protein n=1 Tax=Duganella violaceipulchra TaxID=2849652 RepID=A0AA41H9W0_9BURK|nr:YbbC/YhhH family protein [Duganella violaceicalia]MBV6319868.1 YbbC/YhhH family protein [Duganella violaceicalia]MCP2006313.1 hypothetical protein [Duganella violaceicalia]